MTAAQTRKIAYAVGTIASAVVTILVALNVLDADTAASITDLVKLFGGVIGTGAVATAAVVVHQQQKDGTLDPAPEPEQPDIVINAPVPAIEAAVSLAEKVIALHKVP